ncbi:MAG: basic amino acid ABC transporter substrate-binding protein [Syntrophomonadaceae bacterium]|nr:basic amino acid ABC transporter substrate-binding protein [Syntrophomonadaceae bacterium]
MKKSKFLWLTLLLVMALSVALVGCGGEPAVEEPVVPEETPTIDRIVEAGKLVMLTNAAFPPFEYLGDDNQVAGVDADIAKAIADEIGVELEIVDMDFEGIILALQQGKGDLGVAGMTATDERRESVDFSINYVDAAQVIIVRQDDTSITSAEDLEGKNVGVQLGTTGDLFVTDETAAANVQRYKTGADASMELNSGKIDAVVIDEMPANEIVAASTGLVVLEEPLTEEQYAIAIAKGQEDLVAVVDKVVAEMLESGEIEALIEQHKAATE